MFLTYPELKSVLYEYQLDEITEGSTDIAEMAINAAVEEVKSYLIPTDQVKWRDGRPRYDIIAVFGATGNSRNPLLLEIIKSVALYYVCRLANVDIIQERVKERYDRAVDYLEKVAGIGKYSDSSPLRMDLPVAPAITEDGTTKPFRSGSRVKFNHEF